MKYSKKIHLKYITRQPGAVDKGPCTATLKGDAKGHVSTPAGTLSTVQGQQRLVQKPTPPIQRFVNDLVKKPNFQKKKSQFTVPKRNLKNISLFPSDLTFAPQVQKPPTQEAARRKESEKSSPPKSPAEIEPVGGASSFRPEEQSEVVHPGNNTPQTQHTSPLQPQEADGQKEGDIGVPLSSQAEIDPAHVSTNTTTKNVKFQPAPPVI